MAHRKQVLSLYKRILKVAKNWNSLNNVDCKTEQVYIKDEARKLFRQNKTKVNEEEIREYLREGQSRLELAIHYRNPYPRPVNIPQSTLALPRSMKLKKSQKKSISQSRPIYLKSYEDKT